ncbi:draG, partial [Symbiodinium microadriaticum]
YNGYPVSAEYFGSYSLDAVSIALHAVYHTRTFPEVIVKTVNFCGDADTTGAIAGQIAGAFYGVTAIDSTWMTQLRAWDPLREIELRCVCLYVAGSHEEIVYGSTSTMDFNQPCTGYDTSLVCPEKCRAGV